MGLSSDAKQKVFFSPAAITVFLMDISSKEKHYQ